MCILSLRTDNSRRSTKHEIHFYKIHIYMNIYASYIKIYLNKQKIIQGLFTTILLQSSNISFISLFFSLYKMDFWCVYLNVSCFSRFLIKLWIHFKFRKTWQNHVPFQSKTEKVSHSALTTGQLTFVNNKWTMWETIYFLVF